MGLGEAFRMIYEIASRIEIISIKGGLLYQAIDKTEFCTVTPEKESGWLMNVTFRLPTSIAIAAFWNGDSQ